MMAHGSMQVSGTVSTQARDMQTSVGDPTVNPTVNPTAEPAARV